MRDVIKALTHAKQHVDMYAFIGRERPMLVNERGPLRADRIHLRPERSESWDDQDDARIVAGRQPFGDP
jgi:hypothetical protein